MNGYEDKNSPYTRESLYRQDNGFEIVLRTFEAEPAELPSTDTIAHLIEEAARDERILLIDLGPYIKETFRHIPIDEAWEILENDENKPLDRLDETSAIKLVNKTAINLVKSKLEADIRSIDWKWLLDLAHELKVPVYASITNPIPHVNTFLKIAQGIYDLKVVAPVEDEETGEIIKTAQDEAAHSEYTRWESKTNLRNIVGTVTKFQSQGLELSEIIAEVSRQYPHQEGITSMVEYLVKMPVASEDELVFAYFSAPVNKLGVANAIKEIQAKHAAEQSGEANPQPLTYSEIARLLNSTSNRRPFQMNARIVEAFIEDYWRN